MNILAIGNSFSEDATRYLHGIAKADGQHCSVANLYIGGCSLDHHYSNMLSDTKAYELQYNGNNTGFYVSLGEALLNREWDVITLQQASYKSFDVQASNLPQSIFVNATGKSFRFVFETQGEMNMGAITVDYLLYKGGVAP